MRQVAFASLLLFATAVDAVAQADFASPPTLFGTDRDATCLAVADFDRDGDLDVVLGENGGASLWLNDGGVLSQSSWNPFLALRDDLVLSIAVGDINQDGYVDVVVGTTLFVKLFMNNAGTLDEVRTWRSQIAEVSNGIGLGDVDGDGDLDIVCANGNDFFPRANWVFRNEGGSFAGVADWVQPDTPYKSHGLALADVNGDGLVDAVFGNQDGANRLYLGDASGLLASTFTWEDAEAQQTAGVTLGDIDGDGFLDLACANNLQQPTMHLGTGAGFSPTADWRVSVAAFGRANAITLGDVDRDGDLDIAFAKATLSEVYLNRSTVLDTLPAWSEPETHWTPRSVALVDLDGDGDLEFVSAGAIRPNEFSSAGLHLNRLKPYSAQPDWATTTPKDTRDIELVDMDGDDDLELILAHYNDPNELYSFDSGTYTLTWTSDQAFPTTDAAMGDMDGDGDDDLLCSTFDGSRDFVLVYRNDAGSLTPDTVWSVAADNTIMGAPLSVTWGDFRADGFLDVVVGTGIGFDELIYDNPDGVPERANPLQMGGGIVARDWAPFDFDSDGDLDIVAAENGGRIHFYANFGTIVSYAGGLFLPGAGAAWGLTTGHLDGDDVPDIAVAGNLSRMAWRRGGAFIVSDWLPDEGHWSIRTGDVDGDGDVDVVGIRSTANESWIDVYRNDLSQGPNLSLDPESTALSRGNGRAVALGDIDADGDLDVVVAVGGLPEGVAGARGITSVHMGRRTPAFPGDPMSPTNQLPANPVILRDVVARGISANTWELEFTLYDVESDPVHLTFEYQYEGEGVWRPMVLLISPGLLASAPAGVTHTVVWDITELQFRRHALSVRLHATNLQSLVGASAQHVSRYVKMVGIIAPERPAIDIPSPTAVFPTVTVGDTASVAVVVRNIGNQPLVISAVDLPSTYMMITGAIDTIPTGTQDTLNVDFTPVAGVTSPGDITIHSSDPITPAVMVPVTVDVRELRGTTILLAVAPEIPIDQDVTVEFMPFDQVRVEQGHLFHRAAGASGFEDSIPLIQAEASFVVVIPAEELFESGLEYYIRVENSGVFNTDPSGAPGSFYTRAVASPLSFTSSPTPNTGDGFGEGQPVTVDVVLPPGSEFDQGWLYYREGATADYDTVAMTGADEAATAEIPGTVMGDRGVEYWLEVHTSSTVLTDPPANPATSPHGLRTTLLNLEEPRTYPGMQYRMLSFPADVQGTVEGAIADDVGGADNTRWRLWRYDGGQFREDVERFEHGLAYFFIARNANRLDTAPATALSAETRFPFELRLRSGWNLVGHPFPFDVAWSSVIRDTMAVPGPPWTYNGSSYAAAMILEPFSGYWVHNDADSVVSIWIPPVENPGQTPSLMPPPALAWAVNVTASGEDAGTQSLILAVSEKATDTRDSFDLLLPPATPEQAMEIYLVDATGHSLSRDVRAETTAPGWGHTWSFDVAVSETGRVPVTLAIDFDAVPDDAEVLLLDREVKRTHDLGSVSSIEVFVTGATRKDSQDDTRFVLLVGDAQYIEEHRSLLPGLPTRTVLHQNFPNPFNPTTVIRYELAGPSRVSLKIYDVRGALVRTLRDSDQAAGRYEVGWDGVDNRGSHAASGIYFYRLVSSEVVLTRKMVLLK